MLFCFKCWTALRSERGPLKAVLLSGGVSLLPMRGGALTQTRGTLNKSRKEGPSCGWVPLVCYFFLNGHQERFLVATGFFAGGTSALRPLGAGVCAASRAFKASAAFL